MTYEENPLFQEIDILAKGIANNTKQHGLEPIEPFAFFIRDRNNVIKGGCNGNIGYNWLYIDQLWIDEQLRGKGYGTKLMRAAEKLGLEKKCLSGAVNTTSWEALDLYKKLGYRVELERHGLPKNSIFYFLRKELK
ncbi:MAG TPA: GNAT family N-acetyltransferase [Gammaproteobacteria bacterium]|nr:GNAT family N-acetyltransferase [Gammaproteobacteria bacterium]